MLYHIFFNHKEIIIFNSSKVSQATHEYFCEIFSMDEEIIESPEELKEYLCQHPDKTWMFRDIDTI